MENEVLQTVLTEVLQELKEVKQQQAEAVRELLETKDKVDGFEKKLAGLKLPAPTVDARPVTAAINSGLERIKSTIEAQPKSITRQFRVQLFPDYDTAGYYKRITLWMLILLFAVYLFTLGNKFVDGCISVEQTKAETFQYRKVWDYLYNTSKNSVRNKMDSAWTRSW